ncbi:PQQ-binding-like beta-propeller repeat protein [Rhodothermus marinus]|uniref:PQQ-binding-like beta-propeller repeat protein n=1 Tax=Rhodothermus marinus TaxID=29549 RepID=UPI0037C83614
MRRALGLLGLCVLVGGCRSLQVPVGALVPPEEAMWRASPPLVVRWRRDVEAAPARALVAGRILLVTNRKGDVHAFALPEGRRHGVLDAGRDLTGTPAYRKSLLLVPVALGDASVMAYDLYRRRTVWRRMGDGVEAGLTLDNEVVYVAERWGRVYALDVEDGRERWAQEPEATGLDGVRARPVRIGELLVVADKRGRVVALEARTGRLRWQRQLRPVYADLAVADGLALVPTTRGRLMALEAASGATAWTLALPDTSVHLTTPVMVGSTVYVAGGDGVVRALMLRTGTVRWTWTGGAAIVAAPVADPTAGVLYVGDLRGRLVALELSTGRLIWETRLEGGVLDLADSPFGLVALTRPRHVYLLQSDHEAVALRP